MVPLFERIAWSLCDRVSRVLEPSTVFCLSATDIIDLSSEAKLLLDSWKSIYFVRRAEIEASGRDSRWEFDRKRLFAKTDYIAKICSDFQNIARVIGEFQKIFGPETKSVMLEHQQIDGILLNVATLLRAFSKIEFDPFDPGCQSSWDACLERFRLDVEKIKMDVKNCINNSFKSLRSSQGAFEMLQRFSSSQTEGDIVSVFTEKFQDVLDQYEKELRLVETTFDEGVINAGEHEFTLGPKYLPKVSGAISFERQLFNRIKSPMVRFAQTKELTDTERGRQIRDRYICLARRMKTFEENIFADWKRRIAECLPGLLERKLWKVSDRQSDKRPSRPSLTLARLRTGISSQTTDSTLTNTTRSGPLLPILDKNLYNFDFDVDFDDNLHLAIVETKYLDALGFTAPDLARHLALNERKLMLHRDKLNLLAGQFRETLTLLSPAEFVTLADKIASLRKTLSPAWERLNWNSLIIDDYLAKGNAALSEFRTLLDGIQKASENIENVLHNISNAVLFKMQQNTQPCISSKPISLSSCKDAFMFMADERNKLFDDLALKHASIGRLLVKCEGLIFNSATGKHPKMVPMYEYWEKRVFDAVYQTSQVEKWMSPGRTIIQIHEKILEFSAKLDEVLDITGDVAMGFYMLRMNSLQNSVRAQSAKWVATHGVHLRDRGHNLIKGLQEMLMRLTSQLRSVPKQLDQLKAVLHTIKFVQDSSLEVEQQLIDIDECYRLLRLHGLPVSAAELEEAASVSRGWLQLLHLVRSTTRQLKPTRQNFVVRIQREVARFTQKISAFAERFAACGPGSVGEDLDRGLELMRQYRDELQQLEAERHELLSAEKLLDLPISTYAQLSRIFQDMQSLEKLYRIYRDQKEERTSWSSTLWHQADFNLLSEGIEGYLRALRRLPKEVRSSPLGCALDNHMRAFRDSLPLFANLKHEALRPRHWTMLLERTGQTFAVNPENFTLGNIFSMELHRYEAVISEVLGIALKEFSIEKVRINVSAVT
nr:unnamed protein product [Spirometra erinaceieuropaei]